MIRCRAIRREVYADHVHTYVIQTNVSAGLPRRYTVFVVNGNTAATHVIGREVQFGQARRLVCGERVL